MIMPRMIVIRITAHMKEPIDKCCFNSKDFRVFLFSICRSCNWDMLTYFSRCVSAIWLDLSGAIIG